MPTPEPTTGGEFYDQWYPRYLELREPVEREAIERTGLIDAEEMQQAFLAGWIAAHVHLAPRIEPR